MQKPMQLFSHMLKVSHTSLQAGLAGGLFWINPYRKGALMQCTEPVFWEARLQDMVWLCHWC